MNRASASAVARQPFDLESELDVGLPRVRGPRELRKGRLDRSADDLFHLGRDRLAELDVLEQPGSPRP